MNFFLLIAMTSCGFHGCSQYTAAKGSSLRRPAVSTESAKGFQALKINAIALLPLEVLPTAISQNPDAAVLNPKVFDTQLVQMLENRTSLEIINSREVARTNQAASELKTFNTPERNLTQKERARKFGSQLQAQGVLYGVITHFDQSTGSKFGAERPASVGFKLWLVDPVSGRDVWTAKYENSEQPISENLFRLGEKLKSGVGFRSAEELLGLGFSAAADELEKLRKSPAK